MNIRCPNCGAVHSLDTLINDADASAVLKAVLDMDAELGKAAIRYIGLFRPAKSQLSWSRTAKLLNELMPSIKAATVERDGVSYPAPAAAWIHGFTETLAARDAGRLKTPLKSHGYLYEIVSKWQPSAAAAVPACPMPADAAAVNTKLRQGVHALTQWAGEDWLKQEIAAGLSLLAAQNLKGRPAAQDLPVLAALWEQRLMEHAVARGEVKLIAETDRMRIQTAFKALQDTQEWPNVIELIRALPPRLIPRVMLAKPQPDRAKGREELAKVRQTLNRKGSEK